MGGTVVMKGDERRLVLGDVKKAARPANEVVLTLYQILMGDTAHLPSGTDDTTPVRITSLNMKGLALIEREYGGLHLIPKLDESAPQTAELTKLCGILINQDLPDDQEKTIDEVGRLITAENLPMVLAAVRTLTIPKSPAPTRRVGAAGKLAAQSGGPG